VIKDLIKKERYQDASEQLLSIIDTWSIKELADDARKLIVQIDRLKDEKRKKEKLKRQERLKLIRERMKLRREKAKLNKMKKEVKKLLAQDKYKAALFYWESINKELEIDEIKAEAKYVHEWIEILKNFNNKIITYIKKKELNYPVNISLKSGRRYTGDIQSANKEGFVLRIKGETIELGIKWRDLPPRGIYNLAKLYIKLDFKDYLSLGLYAMAHNFNKWAEKELAKAKRIALKKEDEIIAEKYLDMLEEDR
jgi:hypothetical protein